MNKMIILFILIVLCSPGFAQDNSMLDAEFDFADPSTFFDHSPSGQQFKEAYEYYRKREYPTALKILESILAQDPNAHPAWFLQGKLWGSQKAQPEKALNALRRAVELSPRNLMYQQELAALHHRLQRFPPALALLDDILKTQPDNVLAKYRKAVILHKQGDVNEAEALVDQIPNYEHAMALKGVILQQRGEDSSALFKKIVELYPDNLRARYEYAKTILKKREFDQAQTMLESIIDEDPFYQHALFQLIKIFHAKKMNENVRLAKQSLDTINRLGRDKRNFYRSYLRHHPDTAETHFNMGVIYLEIGRGNLALEQFNIAMENDSAHADAPFYAAQIEMASGRFGEAVPYLEKCLMVREKKAPIHSLMAQCHLETGNALLAKEHLEKALAIDANDPLALRILSIVKKGRPE